MTQIIFPHSWQRLLDGGINRSVADIAGQRTTSFAVDIRDDDSEYRIYANLPGVAKDAVSVQVENNILHIQAKTTPQDSNLLLGERIAGDMSRAFRLPRRVDAENINAALDNGVLTITLPKAADAVARKIAIN